MKWIKRKGCPWKIANQSELKPRKFSTAWDSIRARRKKMVLDQSLILSQDIEYCTVSYISRYISVCKLKEGELMGQLKILPTLAPLFTYCCHSRSTCIRFIPALFSSCRLSSNGHAPWLENDRRIGAHPRTFLAVLQRLQDKRTIEDKMVEWQDNQGYENPFFSVEGFT